MYSSCMDHLPPCASFKNDPEAGALVHVISIRLCSPRVGKVCLKAHMGFGIEQGAIEVPLRDVKAQRKLKNTWLLEGMEASVTLEMQWFAAMEAQ
jgi:hypothetical protein